MLNVDISQKYPGSAKDSHSFYDALIEPNKRFPRPPMIVGSSSLRVDDWKLVARKAGMKGKEPEQKDVRIFNLAEDLPEEHDLSHTHPERARALFKVYKDFLDSRVLREDALRKSKRKTEAKSQSRRGKRGTKREETAAEKRKQKP